jgi:DNA polymerase III alpha subunit
LRPDVNLSSDACIMEGQQAAMRAEDGMALPGSGSIRLGLRYLHDLGQAGSERLLAARAARPFRDLLDFCRRTRLPRSLIGDLIRTGTFDSLSANRRRQPWRAGLRARSILSANELAAQPAGRSVQVAGLIIVRQAPPTAKGHLFITLEDETGLINLILRPDLYTHEHVTLHESRALVVMGIVQREGNAISPLVQQVQRLHQ